MKSFWCLIIFMLLLVSIPRTESNIGNTSLHSEISATSDTPMRVYDFDLSKIIHNVVNPNTYLDFIKKLTENGSRQILTPTVYSEANALARDWLLQEFVEVTNGRAEVEVIGSYRSVLAKLPGYLGMGPALMVGGHFDSVDGAPGANDDATGVAAALELARVMSMYNWPLDIYFGAWNAEEIGLYGSWEVAQNLSARGVEILHYYNVDMLLVVDPSAPLDERVLMAYNAAGPYHTGKYWGDLAKMMSKNVGYDMMRPISSAEFGGSWTRSDHASFIAAGYESSSFLHESGFAYDGAYHSPSDVWDNPDYNYVVAAEAVATIGASMAFTMARTYGEPTQLRYYGTTSLLAPSKYYFAISQDTAFVLNGTWTQGCEVTLYDEYGAQVADSRFYAPALIEQPILDVELTTPGLYTLIIDNQGVSNMEYTIAVEYESDVDGDNIDDSQRFWFSQALFSLDSDSDLLSDGMELIAGTDPNNEDSDADTMNDGWEWIHGLNPLLDDANGDLDEDTLTNVEEYNLGTLPDSADSDGDMMDDAWEVAHGLLPLVPDGLEDPDNDKVPNISEYGNHTLPDNADSDSDLMDDYWEIVNNLNPLANDAQEDPDGDGVSNLEEYNRGTDPHVYDLPVVTIALVGAGAAGAVIIAAIYYQTKWVKL